MVSTQGIYFVTIQWKVSWFLVFFFNHHDTSTWRCEQFPWWPIKHLRNVFAKDFGIIQLKSYSERLKPLLWENICSQLNEILSFVVVFRFLKISWRNLSFVCKQKGFVSFFFWGVFFCFENFLLHFLSFFGENVFCFATKTWQWAQTVALNGTGAAHGEPGHIQSKPQLCHEECAQVFSV